MSKQDDNNYWVAVRLVRSNELDRKYGPMRKRQAHTTADIVARNCNIDREYPRVEQVEPS